jgi:hypothetical protein
MTGRFRSSKFLDFSSGDVFLPPMKLVQQKRKPWTTADKIAIFECRVEVWQLGVATQVLKEMERPDRRAIWSHAAYGLIAITFSYFEMIGKILNPSSKKRNTAGSDFKVGFCDVYPKFKASDGKYLPEVSEFWGRVRNGMYHLAYTKNGLWIHHNNTLSTEDFDTKLASQLPPELGISGQDLVYLMDPHRVTRTIVGHFGDFIARLRQDASTSGAFQAKFKEFFDDFHDPDGGARTGDRSAEPFGGAGG